MMNNRSHLGHFSEFERRNSSSQNSNVDREVLDLIQRIRSCKPYLLKRLKAIEEAGQTKLLREEVKDINYFLEIAKEVRADIIYGRETLEVVLEKMMDMIRLHPIQGAFNSNQINESDEEDESAPRSPSPPSGNDFDSGPRVIPMERNQEQPNDWGATHRREYLPKNSHQSSSRVNEDWSGNEYTRRGDNSSRGDTDMRLDPGFANDGRPPMGRGRGVATAFRDDPRHSMINPDPLRRSQNWTGGGGDPYNSNRDVADRDASIERGRERSRGVYDDYDYRRRSRSRSPNLYSRERSRSRERNRREPSRNNERNINNREQYFRDEDLRDITTRHGEHRNADTGRGFDYDRPPPRDIRERNSDNNRRHDFNDQDNRDNPWSTALAATVQQQQQQQQQHVGLNPTFGSAVSENFQAAFNNLQSFTPFSALMALSNLSPQQQQEFIASQSLLLASQLPNMNMPAISGLLSTPLNAMGINLPAQTNIHMNSQTIQQQQQLGNNSPLTALGPQSPLNINSINSSYTSHVNSAPSHPLPSSRQSGLLPTPTTAVRPNLHNQNTFNASTTASSQGHIPYSASQGNQNQQPGQQSQQQQQQRPPPTIPNRFDVRPRNPTPDLNQFRQRAQQHFSRPRPHRDNVIGPPPGGPGGPNKPPSAPVGSNTTINPNLATNQIVSDLPLDPRRRSQLERQSQQQQQQSHTSDSRHRRPLSSPSSPPDSSPNHSQTTSNNNSNINNKKRDAPQRETSPTLKRIADRVRDTIHSKDKPKTSKLQELRKNFEKHGYHRLGSKGKNTFEEVQSESSESAKSPDKETASTSSRTTEKDKSGEDRSNKRQSSPPATKSASRNKSGKDKSPKRSKNKSVDDGEKSGAGKRSRNSPVKSKDSPRNANAKNANQKSVTSFRIPKIKKPDPPPAAPETLASEEPTRSSPEKDVDAVDTASQAKVTSSGKASINVEVGASATAPRAELSTETDLLLRMFMSKSVGVEDNVLEQIVNNPSAMEKIKSLLKDQVSKIVSDESPTSPPLPAVPLDKIKAEAEDIEDSGRQAVSPNRVEEGEEIPSRSRSVTKKRTSKRRSSLERLHDALREMNFDAILPLGPRRATNTRGQSEAPNDQSNTTTSFNQATRTPQSQSNDTSLSEDAEVVELGNDNVVEESNSPSDGITDKGGPKGKKRKRKAAPTVGGKKRGRKTAGTAVTAAAAIVAVSAIPEFDIGATNVSDPEQTTDPESTPTTTPKKGVKKGRKAGSKEDAPTTTVTTNELDEQHQQSQQKPSRETRSATSKKEASKRATRSLEPPTEARVLRPRLSQKLQQPDIRINAHLHKVKLEQDYNPGVTVKTETVDREGNSDDIEKDATIEKDKPQQESSPRSPSPPVSPPRSPDPTPAEKDAQENVPDDTEKIELNVNETTVFDRSVFLGESSDANSDTSSHVPSHDKLLTDAGAPLTVKKVFPATLFGEYLDSLTQNQLEQEKDLGTNEYEPTSKKTSAFEISQGCKQAIEWMLNTIQFRQDQEESLCSENDDDALDLCNDLLDSSTFNSTRSSDDDDDDNDGDLEDEEGRENDDGSSEEVGQEVDQNKEKSNPQELQIKVEPTSDAEFKSNGLEDIKESQSIIKVESFDVDLPIKDEKEDLNEDSSNEEEGEGVGGRTRNLEARQLYRCANPSCDYTAPTGPAMKEHAFICCNVPSSKQIQCFHCEKKLKSTASLMEHLKIHGKPRQVCSLCSFRCWVSSELTKHMKNVHRVYNCKVVRETMEGEDPIQIMYPKEVASKMTQAQDLTQSHILYASKIQFQPGEVDSVPRSSIFSTLVHCGVCDYSTKVRSNIIRHLKLHAIGGEVPNKAPVNPVPCLERKELMFDKMTNWAGSSHMNKVGGVSKDDTLKFPKYVVDQFRYVCSVQSCKQITGQDDILCSHMKALHFKEKFYTCPHCEEDESTRGDPRNVLAIDKIPHHLKLHGPRLNKCGHCDYIHYSSTSMEKHVAIKHVEKKPIFYLIRDLDADGNPMNRRTSVDDSVKSNERWRCNLCKAILNSWNDAMQHVQTVHKIKNQFECSLCHFGSDSIYAISTHSNTCRQSSQSKASIMIMFLRNENFDVTETKVEDGVNIPIWRRDAPRVKHIRGIFLEDETKPSGPSLTANSSAPKVSQSKAAPSTVNLAAPKISSCQVMLVCPKCQLYKTKNAADMKVHLFNELNYQRYKCTICELQFVTVDSLKVHLTNDHKSSVDLEEAKAELPLNPKLESKVYEIISNQLKNNDGQKSVEDKDGRNIENLLCKHCFLQFSSYHNYRTHILAKHIGSERFKCKYCNLGFWHEVMLKQHHQKSSHADKPYIAVLNKEFEAMLSPDFWFKEYGIPLNKSINSVSIGRRTEDQANNNKYLKCSHCDFTTDSSAALKTHEAQSHSTSDSGGKRSPAKRRSVSTSDGGDKEDLYFSQTPKKVGTNTFKKSNNMSSLFRCEHCSCTFFTKRGVRRHWSRVHSLNELTCRYYEVKSQNEDNLAVHEGVALLCRYCSYETSNATHMQSHHEEQHSTLPCRFKRKKRTGDADGEVTVTVCSDCHCEFENFKKYKTHSQEKHPNSTLKHKTMKVNSGEQTQPELAEAKLLEDSVTVECPSCSQDCGSAKKYETHFKNYHNGREYVPPVFRYARSVIVDEVEIDLREPKKMATTSGRNSSEIEDVPALKKRHGTSNNQTVLYACPKCDFKCSSMESLTNSHLLEHLLAYLCPICNVGFRHSLDALFHLRHFHGDCRLKPSQNPTAYVQFSSLKDQITTISNPKSKDVLIINLSDDELDEEFDDALVLSLDDSSPLHRLQQEDLMEGFDDEDF